MIADRFALPAVLSHSPTRVVFAPGALERIGEIAASEGARHALLVTDHGIVGAGYADRAQAALRRAGVKTALFDGAEENPTTAHVEAGVRVARVHHVDFLIGLGGGSAMDCAKGVNFILTNGGTMANYWGVGKAVNPMLPTIAIPTTAGTGSEAQSFALIADATTHQKMACGDKKAACRVAILDPDLTRTQPARVASASGIDAVSHAIETAATKAGNNVSHELTREAWIRLDRSFEAGLRNPGDDRARADMLLGAHLAGAAIEQSMLGAAHACANPLTRRFGVAHGVAVGVMLPHVIRFNARRSSMSPYAVIEPDGDRLATRVEQMLDAARLPRRLTALGVPEDSLVELSEEAGKQWTATFNPVPVGAAEFLNIYRSAL